MSQHIICRGSALRATVTNADLQYVGSATVHAVVCDAALIADQQLVDIQNERTGQHWSTYVIRAAEETALPRNVISINGPGAHFVRIGDVVTMTTPTAVPAAQLASFAPPPPVDIVGRDLRADPPPALPRPPRGLSVDKCFAKMHRLRVTAVASARPGAANARPAWSPEVFVDPDWLDELGMPEFTNVTVANVNTAGRLFGCVRAGERGQRRADVFRNGAHGGKFEVGDVIILMAYAKCDWRELLDGEAPPIKVAFPFEKPVLQPPPDSEKDMNLAQLKKDVNGSS